jgi:hypothetical protein
MTRRALFATLAAEQRGRKLAPAAPVVEAPIEGLKIFLGAGAGCEAFDERGRPLLPGEAFISSHIILRPQQYGLSFKVSKAALEDDAPFFDAICRLRAEQRGRDLEALRNSVFGQS